MSHKVPRNIRISQVSDTSLLFAMLLSVVCVLGVFHVLVSNAYFKAETKFCHILPGNQIGNRFLIKETISRDRKDPVLLLDRPQLAQSINRVESWTFQWPLHFFNSNILSHPACNKLAAWHCKNRKRLQNLHLKGRDQ